MNPPPLPPYEFELVFHGLILMLFQGSDKRNPTEINAHLLQTNTMTGSHKHFPFLNFSRADLAAGSDMPFKLLAGPDGTQFGRVSLAGLITIEREAGETPASAPLTAIWRPDDGRPTPTLPSSTNLDEHKWLEWVPPLKEANSGVKHPLVVIGNQVAAQVKMCNGELRAANITKDENGDLVPWKFKKSPLGDPAVIEQAIANAMILCIPNLTKTIWIKDASGKKLGLIPPGTGTKVTASLTHLPEDEPAQSNRLEHFEMYYDLVQWDTARPSDLNLPEHTKSKLDTSYGTICPGGR
jgi:hypothetical protein